MTTRYIIDTVMLALPEGQHRLSELEITQLCRGDLPQLERRTIDSIHAGIAAGQRALNAAMRSPACVMAALIEWQGPGQPRAGSAGSVHVPGNPRITVLELWERPYRATLSRYSMERGIRVQMAAWERGTSNVTGWPIGGGEWPRWTRPEYPA